MIRNAGLGGKGAPWVSLLLLEENLARQDFGGHSNGQQGKLESLTSLGSGKGAMQAQAAAHSNSTDSAIPQTTEPMVGSESP